ncbi:MAG: PstS family phosphate ABC transporter substrate-binding protein [Cyanobacteriota bacterium]|nr:PstS family phosphate ABC transporter substrate-binding protein [Cyanobacteriota bacterium]
MNRAASLLLTGVLGWSAPGWAQASKPPAASSLLIGGSSTVFPIMEEAIKGFRAAAPAHARASIQINETGTSVGFRQFCSAQLPIANASRPINRRELKLCSAKGVRFIELPIAFDALTLVVNPRNDWARLITTRELARLWGRDAQGRITRWSQVNIDWPDRPIKLCAPGKDSGTFDYFNKAINGDATNARTDVVSSEDDNVLVRCVADDPNAIGYFGYAYFNANRQRLRPLTVVGPKGPVAPSLATVQNETYAPLSRPLFVYVNDSALRGNDLVRRFITYTMRNGLKLSARAGYIPLPASTYRLVESKLYRHVLGTAFGGDLPVGQGVGNTLRRSLESIKKQEFR